MNEERRQKLLAERKAKLVKFNELMESGERAEKAAKQSGFGSKSAAYSARYEENKLLGKVNPRRSAARSSRPKKSDLIVVNSEDREEDVKIVVMKGPGHVIEKIAAALGGVL